MTPITIRIHPPTPSRAISVEFDDGKGYMYVGTNAEDILNHIRGLLIPADEKAGPQQMPYQFEPARENHPPTDMLADAASALRKAHAYYRDLRAKRKSQESALQALNEELARADEKVAEANQHLRDIAMRNP